MEPRQASSSAHTVAAAIVAVLCFFALLYVIAPIIQSLLNLHGQLFVPERFGGGSEADNPGIWTVAVRAVMASGLSAAGALVVAFRLFAEASQKVVALTFAIVVVLWGALLALGSFSLEGLLFSIFSVALLVIPPLVVASFAWKDEF